MEYARFVVPRHVFDFDFIVITEPHQLEKPTQQALGEKKVERLLGGAIGCLFIL